MSSHSVKKIQQGAILVANDLRTGLTVCLANDDSWSINWQDARLITNEDEANLAEAFAAKAVANNDVIDPYLVDTTREGNPIHTREHLRTTGPSVDYVSTVNS